MRQDNTESIRNIQRHTVHEQPQVGGKSCESGKIHAVKTVGKPHRHEQNEHKPERKRGGKN